MKKIIFAMAFAMWVFGDSCGMGLEDIEVRSFQTAQDFCRMAVLALGDENEAKRAAEIIKRQIDKVGQLNVGISTKVALLEKMDLGLRDSFPFVTEVVHAKVKELSDDQVYNEPEKLGRLLWEGLSKSNGQIDLDIALRIIRLLYPRKSEFLTKDVYPKMRNSGLSLYVPEND